MVSRSATQRLTQAVRRFTLRDRKRLDAQAATTATTERCELCATPLLRTHDHLLDPHARGVFCACSACAMLFPDGVTTATTRERYVRVRSRVAALPPATVREHDLVALGAPVRLVVLCPSTLHDALFLVYPSAAGAVESRAPLSTWHELAAKQPELGAVRHDRDAVIVDLRTPSHAPLHVSLDVAYELLGTLRAPTKSAAGYDSPNRLAAFEARLAALRRAGAAHG